MTREEAFERLSEWASTQEMDDSMGDAASWETAEVDRLWVLTPPGRSNTAYVVTETAVRPVHPSRESLADVIAELRRQMS